jgi:hypothetical protein
MSIPTMAQNIQKRLEEVLLDNGAMTFDLYQDELADQVEPLFASMTVDGDTFIFTVTENNGDVAMMLIESPQQLYINEEARERLRALWPAAYESNLREFIPQFAEELSRNELPVTGVKVESPQ